MMSETLGAIVVNVISSIFYDVGKAGFNWAKINILGNDVDKFKSEVKAWADVFEKNNENTIISTDEFYFYVKNYKVVEKIIRFVMGRENTKKDKEDFLNEIENKITSDKKIKEKLKANEVHLINEFAETILTMTESFIYSKLSKDDQALYYMLREIKNKIDKIISDNKAIKNYENDEITETVNKAIYSVKKIKEETKKQVRDSLLFPWLNKGPSFSVIYDNPVYIPPKVKVLNTGKIMQMSKFMELYSSKETRKIWILGDAGIGKSSALKHNFLDMQQKGENVLYISAVDLVQEGVSAKAGYINELITGIRRCRNNFKLLIDGMDEAFAGNIKGFKEFVSQTEKLNCDVWYGCRSQYFEQYAGEINAYRVEIQQWSVKQSERYVERYSKAIGQANLFKKYQDLCKDNENIISFVTNPFRLSMLIYLIENDYAKEKNIKNIYSLYESFFELWFNKEKERTPEKCSNKGETYKELWEIARNLYDNKSTYTCSENPAVLGVLTTEKVQEDKRRVYSFYHRSFMEYILAHESLEAMKKGPEEVISKLKHNNRSDVDSFIKAGFKIANYEEKNKMIKNMMSAYNAEGIKELSGEEHFYVQNQIVYYMTRMKGMNAKPVEKFIREIYKDEERAIMRQGIAYGAANLGMFDIALDFAKKMEPGSAEDITNRSWTLVFYGDMPEQDPIYDIDDGKAPWERSKNARLRRLKANGDKERAFRAFDLCILRGFYVSRNWLDLSEEDFKIIRDCETQIEGYSDELNEFLTKVKNILVTEYEEHLLSDNTKN